MGYGIKRGGKVKGKGTGTSDDVKKTVPSGSYIMPADSTKQIGAENLEEMGESKEKDRAETVEGMGEPREVNLSNGEFQFTPDQVHQVGVQALDQMKNQTHTPVDQPQIQGGFGIHKKPELFFANGGEVPDYLKRHQLNSQQPAQQNSGFGAFAKNMIAPTHDDGTWNVAGGLTNTATGLGKAAVGTLGGLAGGVAEGARGLVNWVADGDNSDSGNIAGPSFDFAGGGLKQAKLGLRQTFGLSPSAQTDTPASTSQPTSTANKAITPVAQSFKPAVAISATPVSTTQTSTKSATPASQPSIQDQMNSAMWGGEQNTQATQPASTNTNPYAIQQKGNSFSYTNPAAASQARSAGVPELQSSGFAGGIRRTNDPKGVANFMANTREMGPTQDMIDKAVAQRELNIGLQGYGGIARQPQAPQRSDSDEAERRALFRDASTVIKGARGLTSGQMRIRQQLLDGESGLANQRYITDANNATSQTNNAVNNIAALQREAMGQEGQNYRAELGENGQNNRYGLGLQQDREKFNAEYGLKNREMNLTETKEGFGIRKSQRLENLSKMYDHAQTNEQRQSIQERIDRLIGKDAAVQGKDRYMTVGGGQEWDGAAGVMVNRPQEIFDTVTGQKMQMDTQPNNQRAIGTISKVGDKTAVWDGTKWVQQ